MRIYRYSARAAQFDRDALFPAVLAGLLGLWALIAMAVDCNPKLLTEGKNQAAASYVPYEPTEARAPGKLLRCTLATATKPRDI